MEAQRNQRDQNDHRENNNRSGEGAVLLELSSVPSEAFDDSTEFSQPQTLEAAQLALQQLRSALRAEKLRSAQAFHHSLNKKHQPIALNHKEKNGQPAEAADLLKAGEPQAPPQYNNSSCFSCLDCEASEKSRDSSFEDYLATPMLKILAKRLPWLVCLLIVQSFSATILHAFEALLDKHIVLAVFVPMLVGTGGNAGNQPGVMVTRALATGDLNVPQLLAKEGKIAVITASVLSFIAFLRVWMEYPDDQSSAGVIALALFVGIFISILLGIGFSIGLDKLRHCDPADGAAPLLTTISDLLGIALLCGIAEAFIGETK